MELHAKQLQISMNRAVAAQLSPQNAYRGFLMVISKKIFLKRCCISVIIRHDLIVAVIYIFLSQGYSTVGPWSYSKTKHIGNHCIEVQ